MKDLHLTEDNWKIVREVNSYWNYRIKYVSDMENWGIPDKWSLPKEIKGQLQDDCDSYAISKQKTLKDNHNIESFLALCLTELGGGHLVCMIHTDRGAYVLDNRYRAIYHYKDVNYKWISIETEGGKWHEFS